MEIIFMLIYWLAICAVLSKTNPNADTFTVLFLGAVLCIVSGILFRELLMYLCSKMDDISSHARKRK